MKTLSAGLNGASEHQIHSLHDIVLLGVIGLVLGGNLKHRGDGLGVVSQQVSNVISDLQKNIHSNVIHNSRTHLQNIAAH